MADRVDVVTAVIVRGGKILLTQRDPLRSSGGLLWESPGGKVEPNETHVAAMARELVEELDVYCTVLEPLGVIELDPPEVSRPYRVTLYRVDIGVQRPRPIVATGIGWFSVEEMRALQLMPANRLCLETIAKVLEA